MTPEEKALRDEERRNRRAARKAAKEAQAAVADTSSVDEAIQNADNAMASTIDTLAVKDEDALLYGKEMRDIEPVKPVTIPEAPAPQPEVKPAEAAAPVVEEEAEAPAPVVHDPETDDDEVIVPEKPTSKKNVGKVMEMGEDESMAVKTVNKPQPQPQPQPEPEPSEEEAEEQAEDLFAEEEPEEEPTDNSPEKTDESDGNPIEKTDTTDNGGKSAEGGEDGGKDGGEDGGKDVTDETPEDPVLKSLRENNKALYDALERFHSNQEGAMEEMIKYLEGVQKARQTELQQTEKEVREQNLKNYRAQLYGGITELVARIGNVIAASAGAVPAQWKSPQQAWAQKAQQDAVRGDALIRQGRKDIETLNTQLETARNKYTTQVAANALEREKVRIQGNNSLLRYSQSQERNKTNEVAKIALKPAKDLMDSAGKKLNTAKNNLTTLQGKKPADRNSKAIKDAQKAYDDALKEYNDAVAAYKQKYAEVTAAASGSIFGETQK